MKKKWWVRWYGCFAVLGEFTLYTPWWQSGSTMQEPERQIFVGAFWADDWDEIEEILYSCYDKRPDSGEIEISSIEECPDDWNPREDLSDRFPWADWMTPYWERGEYRQEE